MSGRKLYRADSSPIEKIYSVIEREIDTIVSRQVTGELSKDDIAKLKDLTSVLANLQKAPSPASSARRLAAALTDEELLEKLK